MFRLVGEAGGGGSGAVPVARDPGRDRALAEAATEGRVSLTLTNPTVLETLNALVVAHGALTWRWSWCGPPQEAAHAQLELLTFYGDTMTVAGKECRP